MMKPISILIENREVFAKLNYLRDKAIEDVGSWSVERSLYMEEAKCDEALDGYVLTLEDIDSIIEMLK